MNKTVTLILVGAAIVGGYKLVTPGIQREDRKHEAAMRCITARTDDQIARWCK